MDTRGGATNICWVSGVYLSPDMYNRQAEAQIRHLILQLADQSSSALKRLNELLDIFTIMYVQMTLYLANKNTKAYETTFQIRLCAICVSRNSGKPSPNNT